MNATDLDEDTNGEVQYSLGKTLRRKVSHYEMTIQATDCGEPPLSTFKTLSIQISDVNDNKQQFLIAEHTSPGTRFQLHAARDPDAGINSIRTYTITSNDHFDIDFSQSDEDKIPFLVLKKSLDREQKNKHLLFVTAVDGGKPPRSGTLNVSITVLDVNDNRPTFSQDTYQTEIFENVSIGMSVIKVNAIDPDDGTNGEIEYSLSKALSHKVYDIFELDSLSGEIKLKGHNAARLCAISSNIQ
uniref:Cadherin domain-containing protein n=1 Tax=Stegastes partitus TaxID=144197 RepID=A0A3B4ZWV4_9TELE